ncbi:hypothetical protein GCM10008921_21730 [Metaclostridioides mangenotii]
MTEEENNETIGFSVDDAELKNINENTYSYFISSLEKYKGEQKDIKAFINKNKKLKDLEVCGVMLTGQSSNFISLKDKPYVKGASIGVTAKIVPYIQPLK